MSLSIESSNTNNIRPLRLYKVHQLSPTLFIAESRNLNIVDHSSSMIQAHSHDRILVVTVSRRHRNHTWDTILVSIGISTTERTHIHLAHQCLIGCLANRFLWFHSQLFSDVLFHLWKQMIIDSHSNDILAVPVPLLHRVTEAIRHVEFSNLLKPALIIGHAHSDR